MQHGSCEEIQRVSKWYKGFEGKKIAGKLWTSRSFENHRSVGKQSTVLIIVQILQTLCESVSSRGAEVRSNIRFFIIIIIIITVLQTAASYPAGYVPMKPLVTLSPQFVLSEFSIILKLKSTLKGQFLRTSKRFRKIWRQPWRSSMNVPNNDRIAEVREELIKNNSSH